MQLSYVVSATSATTAPSVTVESGCVVLYHGSRQHKIESIVNVGIDEEQAKLCGDTDGSFWASQDWWDAVHYSQLPPYDQGGPAILGFQVPTEMLDYLLRQSPPLAREYVEPGR
ncbi:MAG TPA: hypothetical protein VG125_18455, partial [Pirellulales bacterium]|nr:hypothetical protein [Pirellulales bacterium]